MKEIEYTVPMLDKDINEFIIQGVEDQNLDTFNELALRAFELQYKSIPLYAKYCEKRGMTPREIHSWRDIPAVPTDVFKAADLSLFPLSVCHTFMTSGTTDMGERGRIHYDEAGLRLMDATIHTAASAFLFPDRIKADMFIIAPEPESAPHMVMAYGMQRLREYFGLPRSRFFIGENGFDIEIETWDDIEAEERDVDKNVIKKSKEWPYKDDDNIWDLLVVNII